ncbi:hypothetical protein M8818_001348 [Zalaria obscura]|uniref:Uncharacterized protein n=1 Tax=Zalaria obscura TaxID=2024903 RepID=A0ACC3SM04_9PEZI
MESPDKESLALGQIYQQHLPVVQQASSRLQYLMGIAPGTRITCDGVFPPLQPSKFAGKSTGVEERLQTDNRTRTGNLSDGVLNLPPGGWQNNRIQNYDTQSAHNAVQIGPVRRTLDTGRNLPQPVNHNTAVDYHRLATNRAAVLASQRLQHISHNVHGPKRRLQESPTTQAQLHAKMPRLDGGHPWAGPGAITSHTLGHYLAERENRLQPGFRHACAQPELQPISHIPTLGSHRDDPRYQRYTSSSGHRPSQRAYALEYPATIPPRKLQYPRAGQPAASLASPMRTTAPQAPSHQPRPSPSPPSSPSPAPIHWTPALPPIVSAWLSGDAPSTTLATSSPLRLEFLTRASDGNGGVRERREKIVRKGSVARLRVYRVGLPLPMSMPALANPIPEPLDAQPPALASAAAAAARDWIVIEIVDAAASYPGPPACSHGCESGEERRECGASLDGTNGSGPNDYFLLAFPHRAIAGCVDRGVSVDVETGRNVRVTDLCLERGSWPLAHGRGRGRGEGTLRAWLGACEGGEGCVRVVWEGGGDGFWG